jgi:cell division transport system ATP-binding protein
MLDFRSVTKTYGQIEALAGVNFRISKGEFVSLVGPSGAGKSTIVKLLIREEVPTKGEILVANRDITQLSRWELPFYRRQLGIVFQDFRLLPNKSVYENVAFALQVSDATKEEIEKKVPAVLDMVGMLQRADNFPRELSGGEKQRAAIARALVHDPKILLADEPTGNLDPVNTWEIIELLFKINQRGTMVILATHDKEIVDTLKKRVITLRAGRVVADQEKGKYLL